MIYFWENQDFIFPMLCFLLPPLFGVRLARPSLAKHRCESNSQQRGTCSMRQRERKSWFCSKNSARAARNPPSHPPDTHTHKTSSNHLCQLLVLANEGAGQEIFNRTELEDKPDGFTAATESLQVLIWRQRCCCTHSTVLHYNTVNSQDIHKLYFRNITCMNRLCVELYSQSLCSITEPMLN